MRVLVVEDEASVATGVTRELSAAGYLVDVASDGEWGLELALTRHYDVIVLDVMLPKVNGYEVCRTLRKNGNEAAILMLTAKAGEWDVAEGLDLGADDYLTKPFAIEELLARIRALLRRATPRSGHRVLAFADITLDPATREVRRGALRIDLRPTEFALLEVLMSEPGRVMTRSALYEAVWGYDFGRSSKTLDVYIGYLRRKMEAGGAPRLIHTVRDVGYVLRSG